MQEGLFRDRADLESFVGELRAMQAAPTDTARYWRHGLGAAVREPAVKVAELGNWLRRQVLPSV